MFKKKKFLDEKTADQAFFENNDFQSANKEVDNILKSADATEASKPKAAEAKVNIEEAKWGEDDDSLGSLDDELNADAAAGANVDGNADGAGIGADIVEPDIFVPPSPGADPYQAILR